jgi:pyroglutamyl-peptidase
VTRSIAQPVRILLTGFEPFPGVPQNASEELVRRLGDAAMPGIELFSQIIPVAWADAKGVAREAIAKVEPHAVLHFGVSRRASCFEIETCAHNLSCTGEDCKGALPPWKRLDPSGKAVLQGTLPALSLLRALKASGYPAEISNHAGRYLCNAVYYWSLAGAATHGPHITFIHLPAIGIGAAARSRLTMKDAIGGAHILIRASAQAVLRGFQRKKRHNWENASHGPKTIYRDRGCGRIARWHAR